MLRSLESFYRKNKDYFREDARPAVGSAFFVAGAGCAAGGAVACFSFNFQLEFLKNMALFRL